MLEDLIARGALVERAEGWVLLDPVELLELRIPASLQQMVEGVLDGLNHAQRRILEAASVAGEEFWAAAVAAGTGFSVERVEEYCAAFARWRQLLRVQGEGSWPDGTVASRYSFAHGLYQQIVYQRVTAARRLGLHRRIGARLEEAYGAQAHEIAGELVNHFERGCEYARAVHCRARAAQNALRGYAYQEAILHLMAGLELLRKLPESPDRNRQELTLQMGLGPAVLGATKEGFDTPILRKGKALLHALA